MTALLNFSRRTCFSLVQNSERSYCLYALNLIRKPAGFALLTNIHSNVWNVVLMGKEQKLVNWLTWSCPAETKMEEQALSRLLRVSLKSQK